MCDRLFSYERDLNKAAETSAVSADMMSLDMYVHRHYVSMYTGYVPPLFCRGRYLLFASAL